MNRINNQSQTSGLSLLELLIYIAILAVLTLFIAGIFISISRGRGASEARSEVNSNIRFAIEKISQDLRAATSSAAINTPNSTTTPTSVLNITLGANTIEYATTTAGQLRRSLDGSPENITSDLVEVNSLSFKRLQNRNQILGKDFISIEINIGARYKSESPDWQYKENKKTTIGIRN